MTRTRQFVRTDREIIRAVLHLAEKMPFEKITVQQILDEAMINRSTFYQHFPDKYAVLERLQETYLDELMQIAVSVSGDDLSLDMIDRLFLPFFQAHRKELRLLLSGSGANESFSVRLKHVFGGFCMMLPLSPTPLEANLLAGLLVDYLVYVLDHEEAQSGFSSLMTESLMKITRISFRLYSDEAGEAFRLLLQNYSQR